MSLGVVPRLGIKSHETKFNPYDDNGGTVVAIAGDNFVLIASDTRLSTGYSIYTRHQSKLFKLSDKSILGCAGCWSDVLTLTRLLKIKMRTYQHEHNKTMSTAALAQMLSTELYYKRFFPYYVSNALAGLDANGEGWIYRYDPIGNMDRVKFTAEGSSGALLQPLLDNQVGLRNMTNADTSPITVDKALSMVQDVFISAAERDIYTGDRVHVNILTAEGLKEDFFELRKD